MTVTDFTQYRTDHADKCDVCGEIECPGIHSVLACARLWGDPEIKRIEWTDGFTSMAVEFDRSGLIEYEEEEED